MMCEIKDIAPKLAKELDPIFEESARTNISSPDSIIARFTQMSLMLG